MSSSEISNANILFKPMSKEYQILYNYRLLKLIKYLILVEFVANIRRSQNWFWLIFKYWINLLNSDPIKCETFSLYNFDKYVLFGTPNGEIKPRTVKISPPSNHFLVCRFFVRL